MPSAPYLAFHQEGRIVDDLFPDNIEFIDPELVTSSSNTFNTRLTTPNPGYVPSYPSEIYVFYNTTPQMVLRSTELRIVYSSNFRALHSPALFMKCSRGASYRTEMICQYTRLLGPFGPQGTIDISAEIIHQTVEDKSQ